MKQFILAIIAFFILISIYTIAISIEPFIAPEEENNTTTTSTQTITESNVTQINTTPKQDENRTTKQRPKAPRITNASKRLFLKNTTEAIQKVKTALDAEHKTVYELSIKTTLTPDEQKRLDALKNKYRLETTDALLQRLKTHPISIVVAQAALETGWGSSRFYREANNIFGIWSFNKNEPRIAAGVQREGKKTIYVKKYPNLEASIAGYYRMISRGRAYKAFRKARTESDNPFDLITYLDRYSELRHEYIKRLYYVIKSNHFYELDTPIYQPPGWSNIKAADPKYLLPPEDVNTTKNENNISVITSDLNKTIGDQNITIESNTTLVMDANLSESNLTVVIPDINQSIPDSNLTVESNTTISTDDNGSEVEETVINKDINISSKVPDVNLSKDVNTTVSTPQELITPPTKHINFNEGNFVHNQGRCSLA